MIISIRCSFTTSRSGNFIQFISNLLTGYTISWSICFKIISNSCRSSMCCMIVWEIILYGHLFFLSSATYAALKRQKPRSQSRNLSLACEFRFVFIRAINSLSWSPTKGHCNYYSLANNVADYFTKEETLSI